MDARNRVVKGNEIRIIHEYLQISIDRNADDDRKPAYSEITSC